MFFYPHTQPFVHTYIYTQTNIFSCASTHTVPIDLCRTVSCSVSSDRKDVELRQEGSHRLRVLHPVAPRGVGLLCGRGSGAVLLQLHHREAGEDADRKLLIQGCERRQLSHPV